MIIAICGGRHWTNGDVIDDFLSLLTHSGTLVVTGDCRGVDWYVGKYCHERDIPCRRKKADWDRYGRAAGPIRNKKILDEYKPKVVVAFHDDIENSKGTKDMLNQAKSRGIPTILITGSG